MAHQFWFSSFAPPGSGGGRTQTEEERKEKKEQAEYVMRAEHALAAAQAQRIQQRAEREDRKLEREVREHTEMIMRMQERERAERETSTASLQSICRAPIASLDCMEELSNEQLAMHVAPTKEALLTGYHSGTPLALGNHVSRQNATVTPGLRYRNLGKSGLRVSNVGLGTWVTFGASLTEEQADEVITLAYESGINVFDLSEAYSGPRAEIELGRILARRGWKRSSYIVCTKIYWNSKTDERGLSRKHILECVKASLARLNLDYIDVIILHKADPMCPMEEIVRTMNHVISQGWALYWGTARWSMVEVMEAYTNCRTFNCVTPICEQAEYHMFCREKTELYMPELYNKIGVGLMAWAPITMGLMGGKVDEGAIPLVSRSSLKHKYASFSWTEDETNSKECPSWLRERLQPDESKKQQEKMRDITLMAEKLGCTLTQLSIAWCLKNESVQCLLLGATTVEQLYDSIQSLQLVPKLNTSLMAELERILENKPSRPPIVSTLALR